MMMARVLYKIVHYLEMLREWWNLNVNEVFLNSPIWAFSLTEINGITRIDPYKNNIRATPDEYKRTTAQTSKQTIYCNSKTGTTSSKHSGISENKLIVIG